MAIWLKKMIVVLRPRPHNRHTDAVSVHGLGIGPFFGRENVFCRKASTENMDPSPFLAPTKVAGPSLLPIATENLADLEDALFFWGPSINLVIEIALGMAFDTVFPSRQ